jgi:hypothetical protein
MKIGKGILMGQRNFQIDFVQPFAYTANGESFKGVHRKYSMRAGVAAPALVKNAPRQISLASRKGLPYPTGISKSRAEGIFLTATCHAQRRPKFNNLYTGF